MNEPSLPDVARLILKGCIVSLGTAGLITMADAEFLLQQLKLSDA